MSNVIIDEVIRCPECNRIIDHVNIERTMEPPPAPAKDGMSERIYLNGYQIKQLAAMVDDDDECELVLAKFPDAEDVETKEKMPAGLYAWYCDYPDEGRTYLPDSAAYEGKEEGQ